MSKKNQNKNNETTKLLVEENVVTNELAKQDVMETEKEIVDEEAIKISEEVKDEEVVTPESVTEEKEEEIAPETVAEEVVVKEEPSPVKENKKCKCKKEMTYSDMFGYMWNGQNF